MSGHKYCVIHGHFYQPPRESPWFREIIRQESAAPYHDWNERIFDECYRNNAFSRILDETGRIVGVNNNYSYMSFNFGPTLFKWLAEKKPLVYERIIEADRRSCEYFDGHGSAVAQVYNHTILPHASRRDKITQIRWAKSFFHRHFGRDPEGLWLSETAINSETVEVLIRENIKFVILSPNQAEAFRTEVSRKKMETDWYSVDKHGLDPRYPYRVYSYDRRGRRKKGYLSVFFFDEPVSRAISFEDLLDNADILAGRLKSCFDDDAEENQLVSIATDGETFGHHKKDGDMCLAYFFKKKAEEEGLTVVNYASYLAIHPPTREVKLKNARGEGTAWSCAHGTGRWIRDCGCSTGGGPDWNQAWRGPLREAMDYLNQEISMLYEQECEPLFSDPSELRNRYEPFIDSKEGVDEFLQEQARRRLTRGETDRIVMLLESQVYMQYAYTSCAWFFNDVTGLETVQNIRYALRAWQLAWPYTQSNFQLDQFQAILREAKSNIGGKSGATILAKELERMSLHMERAAFTAALNNYIYSDSADFNLDAYTVSIETLVHISGEDTDTDDATSWEVFFVDVLHCSSREEASMILALSHVGRGEVACRLFDAKFRDSVVEKQSISHLMEQEVCHRFTLSDAFTAYCETLTQKFVTDFASETLLNYISWADGAENNNRLNIITALNDGLPPALSGIVSFFLEEEWYLVVQQLVKNRLTPDIQNALDEIYRKSRHFGVPIDMRRSAEIFDDMLIAAIRDMNIRTICRDRIGWLRDMVNAVRRYDIPVRRKQIQDYFYLAYKRLAKFIQERKDESGEFSAEERECIDLVNSFAEEIGFSSEKCRL
ncbi:MAG: DUF3536 domain-containing protein [Fibrobacterota bacterium]